MRKRIFIIWVLALLSLGLMAQEQQADTSAKESKQRSKVFTGFSGGMMVHAGYLFSDNPQQVFSNTGLGDWNYVKGLPKSGFCYGLGGALRAHLIDHIHLGAEGFVSTMPLASMGTGSNVRTGWGGVSCDFYANWCAGTCGFCRNLPRWAARCTREACCCGQRPSIIWTLNR